MNNKQSKFELLLKQLEYTYSESLIIGGESRLRLLEHLMKLHSSTIFEYFSIDYSDQASRIKSIKCQLLVMGLWGQSKHGKNVDLNKLILGMCSYDQSLNFIYQIAKWVTNTIQQTDLSLFRECMHQPHSLINTQVTPFPVSFPKDVEYQDINEQQLNEEIGDILQLQQQDIVKLNARVIPTAEGLDLVNNEKQLIEYSCQIKQVNKQIDKLKGKNVVLQQIQQQNDAKDNDRYTMTFPQQYSQIINQFEQLTITNCNSSINITEVQNRFDECVKQNMKII